MTRVVVCAGSMAAGKSTVAATVTRRLREAGREVALVSLDEAALMPLPTPTAMPSPGVAPRPPEW